METISIILVLLVATRLCGAIAVRLRQPVLLGELVAGIALGLLLRLLATDIPVLGDLSESHHFMALTDLGIFFLMLLGGIEMHPRELIESSVTSVIVATSAMILPLAAGFAVAWAWLPETDLRFAQALFVGIALAITAVPVAIKVLMDMHLLRTRVGKLIVSAAVIDDLLSLILLSILTAIISTGELPTGVDLLMLALRVLSFLAVVVFLGRIVLPPVARFTARLGLEEMEFSFLLVVGVAFAVLAEVLGLHFILGAFAAGLFFGHQTISEPVYEDVRRKVSAITTGFLAPIFFASIGLELDLAALAEVPVFLTVLVAVAFLGKFIGAAIPALFSGFTTREAAAVGTAMSARGAVELIIAGIALRAGLFNVGDDSSPVVENLFSSVVIVAVLTTIAAPIGLRVLLPQHAGIDDRPSLSRASAHGDSEHEQQSP